MLPSLSEPNFQLSGSMKGPTLDQTAVEACRQKPAQNGFVCQSQD